MVPGFLQGRYTEADLAIDLAALASRAGVRLCEATAEEIDVRGRTVRAGEEMLPFDVLSLDVGSTPAGLAVPGVREHAVTVRPMRQALALRNRVDALAVPGRRGPVRVTVVGGGAGGVEVALAVHRRIREAGSAPGGHPRRSGGERPAGLRGAGAASRGGDPRRARRCRRAGQRGQPRGGKRRPALERDARGSRPGRLARRCGGPRAPRGAPVSRSIPGASSSWTPRSGLPMARPSGARVTA